MLIMKYYLMIKNIYSFYVLFVSKMLIISNKRFYIKILKHWQTHILEITKI